MHKLILCSLLVAVLSVREGAALRAEKSQGQLQQEGALHDPTESQENPQVDDDQATLIASILDDIEDYLEDDKDEEDEDEEEEELDVDAVLKDIDINELARMEDMIQEVNAAQVDRDQADEDCTFASESENLLNWLNDTKKNASHRCEDFGPRFGLWGQVACPTLAEIVEDVLAGSSVASGGKSGTTPIVSAKFVVKVIDEIEHEKLHQLLHQLRGHRADTLLAPTCRSLIFKVGSKAKHVQISPNIQLGGVQRKPNNEGDYDWTHLFDLKGNYGWSNRAAERPDDYVLKDKDFKHLFPEGVALNQVMLPQKDQSKDMLKLTGDDATKFLARTAYADGKLLLGQRLMDYSLLLHVVKFPSVNGQEVWQLNKDKPWAMVSAKRSDGKEEMYAMSFGIIDVLMHEDDNRGFWNKLASGITFSKCQTDDLDPIPALPYWIRFMRMMGLQLKYPSKSGHCTSCLGEKPGAGYTYFPSKWAKGFPECRDRS